MARLGTRGNIQIIESRLQVRLCPWNFSKPSSLVSPSCRSILENLVIKARRGTTMWRGCEYLYQVRLEISLNLTKVLERAGSGEGGGLPLGWSAYERSFVVLQRQACILIKFRLWLSFVEGVLLRESVKVLSTTEEEEFTVGGGGRVK